MDRPPEEAIEEVLGKIEVPPENILSRPIIEGDMVEKVVPLSAFEETIEGLVRRYWYGFDDLELTDSSPLRVETGLDMLDRSWRAFSIACISPVVR